MSRPTYTFVIEHGMRMSSTCELCGNDNIPESNGYIICYHPAMSASVFAKMLVHSPYRIHELSTCGEQGVHVGYVCKECAIEEGKEFHMYNLIGKHVDAGSAIREIIDCYLDHRLDRVGKWRVKEL